MLRALGLWDALANDAQAILDIKVSDGRAGEGASPLFVHFDHADLSEGPMGYMIEDRHLRSVLMTQIKADKNIEYLDKTLVLKQDITTNSSTIYLSNGGEISSQLLIGADGRGSLTADRAGIQRNGWAYDQASLVCAVEHQYPHEGVAHQFFTPAGPLAILPLTGNRSSIVWTENRERAAVISALPDDEYMDALRPVFGDFLGDIRLSGARYTYPLALSVAQDFVRHRVALVGDAAHGIHPLAGQGLNLGLSDIATLAEVIADAARRGEDIGGQHVLKRYQAWRRGQTMQMVAATDALNKLFSNDNSVLRAARNIGLNAVNATPAVRRSLMRKAAGFGGDLPRLMQGLQI